MITVRLGEADRAALGAPEAMTYDPARVRLADVRALKRHAGMDVEALAEGLKARDVEAVAALVWLCLRRAGVEVAYDELDFDLSGLGLEVEAGKATGSAGVTSSASS